MKSSLPRVLDTSCRAAGDIAVVMEEMVSALTSHAVFMNAKERFPARYELNFASSWDSTDSSAWPELMEIAPP